MNEITNSVCPTVRRAWGVQPGMAVALAAAAVASLGWLLAMAYSIGTWAMGI
ncbi:hypothetical protein [Streptomyces meridianus]|uniref:Uncharacterized protein n=1 Tax=Streptomyces meridianus TaxID=2938945 RepID=A0ABT0XBV3_9ACTN|nr:hypothetical protein [Streptomyces meridianus]MCM2579899.1 hypothetical protein [Streptomyces meridianus]